MNTSPSSPAAAEAAGDPRHDVVPGIPPVPITIWRTPYQQADTHPYPSALAKRIVATFSRPGDTVADITGGRFLQGPCVAAGRAYVAAGLEPAALPAASLVVVDWAAVSARPGVDAAIAAMLRAVRLALRPGGHLVVLTPDTGAGPAARHLVAGCLATGLTYLQNIIALRADIKAGRLVAHPLDLAACHSSAGDTAVKVHADLFVFTAPATGGAA